MSFYWTVTPEEAWGELLDALVDEIERRIVAYAHSLTDEIADWMKANARWEDRSGEARASLYSDVIHLVRESVLIFASHGPAIAYALYLETVRGGFFGIIADTIDHFGPKIFHDVQAIMVAVIGR